jgi:hypothetical protein
MVITVGPFAQIANIGAPPPRRHVPHHPTRSRTPHTNTHRPASHPRHITITRIQPLRKGVPPRGSRLCARPARLKNPVTSKDRVSRPGGLGWAGSSLAHRWIQTP